jgi:hypothetical protein
MITRRRFAKSAGVLALMAVVPEFTACSFASVYAEMLKYVPLGLSAVSAVLSILTGNGIAIAPAATAIIALIKTGFADLQTAITQYQDAPAGQKSGLLGAISEGLTVVEANIQQFWANLDIPDAKLASLVEGLLGIITTTLAGFQTQLPAPATPVASNALRMRAALGKLLPSTPVKRSPAKFKAAFNNALGTAYEAHKI